MNRFVVATFNVNSIRSRMPVIRRWLEDSEVDVLCVQETKTVDDTFPVADIEELGYGAVFHGEKAYNGVAIISRKEPDEVHFGFDDGEEPDPQTRVVRARFGDISILNTYVPQGKSIEHSDYAYKLRFMERTRQLFEKCFSVEERLLWMGDLNVAPTESDVTNPERKRNHVCFHEDIRRSFERVKNWGLVDVFRKHRPGEGEFTFWDYRVKNALTRNIGWRIDHVLATQTLADLSVDCFADRGPRSWEKPSDHTPVVAIFDL